MSFLTSQDSLIDLQGLSFHFPISRVLSSILLPVLLRPRVFSTSLRICHPLLATRFEISPKRSNLRDRMESFGIPGVPVARCKSAVRRTERQIGTFFQSVFSGLSHSYLANSAAEWCLRQGLPSDMVLNPMQANNTMAQLNIIHALQPSILHSA